MYLVPGLAGPEPRGRACQEPPCEEEEGESCLKRIGRPGHLKGDRGPYSVSAWEAQRLSLVKDVWPRTRTPGWLPPRAVWKQQVPGFQGQRELRGHELQPPHLGFGLHQTLPLGYRLCLNTPGDGELTPVTAARSHPRNPPKGSKKALLQVEQKASYLWFLSTPVLSSGGSTLGFTLTHGCLCRMSIERLCPLLAASFQGLRLFQLNFQARHLPASLPGRRSAGLHLASQL